MTGPPAVRSVGDGPESRGSDQRRPHIVAIAPLLGVGSVAATMLLLHLLGQRALPGPPLGSWVELRRWAEESGPVTMALVVLRLAALGVGYHLIATTALATVGRLMRWPGLVRLAERATLAPLRGTFRRLAGIGLSASVVLATPIPSIGASGSNPSASVATAERLSGEASLRPLGPAGPADPADPADHRATMVVVSPLPDASSAAGRTEATVTILPAEDGPGGSSGSTATMRVVPASPPDEPAATDASAGPTEGDPATEHVVVVGDHLWAIAEQQLATALGRQPSDAEIAPYWRSVVAANPQLADPDLVFPGDTVHVPPVPRH